jgi:hypothetical protein
VLAPRFDWNKAARLPGERQGSDDAWTLQAALVVTEHTLGDAEFGGRLGLTPVADFPPATKETGGGGLARHSKLYSDSYRLSQRTLERSE